jgi:hypothetical protein
MENGRLIWLDKPEMDLVGNTTLENMTVLVEEDDVGYVN